LLSEEVDLLYNQSSAYDPHENELPYLPRMAVGGGHVALAWTAAMSDDPDFTKVYVRVMPEGMCDQ
jgi:hypothetical protein